MRQGYYARLVFSGSGNLIAIATGSDACAEHECGSKPMMEKLCNQHAADDEIVRKLKQGESFLSRCLSLATGKPGLQYPDLLESKRITKVPESLRFVEKEGDAPEAILSCSQHAVSFDNAELRFQEFFSSNGDKDVAGAWDEKSFAIRVRGKKYTKALKEFYQAMLDKKVVFAGTFFERRGERLSGVVLANENYFGKEDRESIEKAQVEYESKLRLKSKDDTTALYREMQELSGATGYFGHLWVMWANKEQTEVVYGLNPSRDSMADYLGPYTRQELLDWATAKFGYRLQKNRKAA